MYTGSNTPHSFRIPIGRRKFYSDIFFPRTNTSWHRHPRWCFPDHYDFNLFKSLSILHILLLIWISFLSTTLLFNNRLLWVACENGIKNNNLSSSYFQNNLLLFSLFLYKGGKCYFLIQSLFSLEIIIQKIFAWNSPNPSHFSWRNPFHDWPYL